jgi:type VI protein secretion system component VasF
MNHHEQHHQHHEKEREKRIQHQKEHERHSEKQPWRIHPLWFVILGTACVAGAVLTWILAVP